MNDHVADVGHTSEPGLLSQQARGAVRWVCTRNPFYVISALLVFAGLRMSFDPQAKLFPTLAILAGLGGYTLLLALTACLLVRFGNVWNDVRTVLLLVVLMFLAITVFFDDILINDPPLGVACAALGLLFAAVLSEGLLRGMRLRLPPWFRAPYYLILALFFLYPVLLSPHLRSPNSPALLWGLFGFSSTAGVVFLTLLPAIRCGPSYVAKNGSPWPWPLYPWVLFGLLGCCVCARAYYLCLSVHYLDRPGYYQKISASIFGPYFLVPFFLACGVLLLEAGIVSRSRGVLRTALTLPVVLLALTLLGRSSDAVYARFLEMFMRGLGGSPLYLTLLAAVVFYAFAALRRVPLALGAMSFALAALAVVGPGTVTLHELVAPRPLPVVAVAALQSCVALLRRDFWRVLIATACLVAACAAGLADAWTTHRGIAAYHVALVSVMLIGALRDDALARLLRCAGAVLLLPAGLTAAVGGDGSFSLSNLPPEILRAYLGFLIVVAVAYGYFTATRMYLAIAATSALSWVAMMSSHGYRYLRLFIAGLDQIAWGLAFFLLAVLISLAKAGAFRKRGESACDKVSRTAEW